MSQYFSYWLINMFCFANEAARLAHSQARKVNDYLMSEYFDNQLSEGEIALLGNTLGLVDFYNFLSTASSREQLRGLICFFLGKSKNFKRLPERLIEFLPPELIALAALLTGRLSVIPPLNFLEDVFKYLAPKNREHISDSLMSKESGEGFIAYLEFDISANLKIRDVYSKKDLIWFYQKATEKGHKEILLYLEKIPGFNRKGAIEDGEYYAYQLAAKNGHKEILIHFEETDEFSALEAAKAGKCLAYQKAAENGHQEILTHLETIVGFNALEASKADCYAAYRKAAGNGHEHILSYLEKIEGFNQLQAANAFDHDAYRSAAENGHRNTLIHLENIKNYNVIDALNADNYDTYVRVAGAGHKEILIHFESIAHFERSKAAYYAYVSAALNAHKDILIYLEKIEGFNPLDAAKASNYTAYRMAVRNGHKDILIYLEKIKGFNRLAAANAIDYESYRDAILYGHKNIFDHLENIEGFCALDAARARNYFVYQQAARNGDKKILDHLENIEGFCALDAATDNNYGPYRYAALHGHIEILKHLEGLDGFNLSEAVKADNYGAYRFAAREGHTNVLSHLLQINAVFSYAEKHDYEYGENYIYLFIASSINKLREEKRNFEESNPNRVFDVDPDEAIKGFYMIRNLIRRGVDREYGNTVYEAEQLGDDIRFLLSIPSVKSLCHQVVRVDEGCPGHENELLRLANRIGNEEAAGILLQIPMVRELAESANFYPEDIEGGLNLRELAQDRESSMVALSASERRFVEKTKSHYLEKIQASGGIDAVFQSLKEALKCRYEEAPATIQVPVAQTEMGEVVYEIISLPFEWDALQVLRRQLTEDQYHLALKAYYSHDSHTAYRFISKPNYWIDPNASYVYISDDRQTRWSTFEGYQSLISLFYTAAFDEATPAIDGYTIESRKECFIRQLALIGRAHNWDRVDENGEEQDDKEADKPSCYSGMNRRLFQSVLGHPLFEVLTDTIVIRILNEHIRAYFESVISFQNVSALNAGYTGMINYVGDIDSHLMTLKALDLSDAKKEEIIKSVSSQLSATYKGDFDEQKADFVNAMKQYCNSGVSGAHFIDYQTPCALDTLLDEIKEAKEKNIAEWVVGKWQHGLWQKRHKENQARINGTTGLRIGNSV